MRSIAVVVLAVATGCGAQRDPDPCEGVECGGLGTCEVGPSGPLCACEEGTVTRGLSCCQPELQAPKELAKNVTFSAGAAAAFDGERIVLTYADQLGVVLSTFSPQADPLHDPVLLSPNAVGSDVAAFGDTALAVIGESERIPTRVVALDDGDSTPGEDVPLPAAHVPEGLPDVEATGDGLLIGVATHRLDPPQSMVTVVPFDVHGVQGIGGFESPSGSASLDLAVLPQPRGDIGALVAWVDPDGALAVARLTANGVLFGDPIGVEAPSPVQGVAIASTTSAALVVHGTAGDGVWAVPIGLPDIEAGEPVRIATEELVVGRDSLSASATGFFVTLVRANLDNVAVLQPLDVAGRATGSPVEVDVGFSIPIALWLRDHVGIVVLTPVDLTQLPTADPDVVLLSWDCP